MNKMDGRDSRQETNNKTSDNSEDNRKEEREAMKEKHTSENTEKAMTIENKGMDVGTPQRDNEDRSKMKNNNCNAAIAMGDGFWLVKSDEKDLLLQREWKAGKVEIMFNDMCRSAAWAGVSSELENSALNARMPEYVAQALSRYERIMWMSRPPLSFGEAKLIALALLNNPLAVDLTKVGLKESLYISLSECEMECVGLYKECGVNQSILLGRVESMTPIEIFSLVHSAEAFSCGDYSDNSLETYFNITSSRDSNVENLSGCDKQEVNP